MSKKIFSAFFLLFLCATISAQITTTPAFIPKGYNGEIVITFDPAKGNGGMTGATKCYAHTGLITEKSQSNGDWKYATKTWRGGEEKYKMTKQGSVWTLKIPNIYVFYNCPQSEEILKMAFVFNDGPNGSKEGKTADGSDIFVDLVEAGLNVKFTNPSGNQLVKPNSKLSFAISASAEANISLNINDKLVASGKGLSLSHDYTFANAGDYKCIASATSGNNTVYDTLTICALGSNINQARPKGLKDGITYYADPTKATLSLYCKDNSQKTAQNVFVLGDFNDWTFSTKYQMKQDGNTGYFWLDIDGLVAGKEYAFQYAIKRADGTMVQISDPYTEKTTDKEDKWLPEDIYANKLEYPTAAQGPTAVLQTGKAEFKWSDATKNFKRPDKNNLIIYEVWAYDFSPLRSFNAITKRLDYIENLGVNAIELMPVCEFEGNISWGYNPTHYFAVDKAYGSSDDFKTLIDECHKRGIAVIMDMVFNHATGLNPMNKMFPLKNNPYFNVRAPHDGNVFEDFNHEFDGTLNHFTRVLNFWLEEYKIDGYRMDLSHGLCGPDCNEQKRIIYHYFNEGVKKVSPNAYFILEHWDGNRTDYANNGMMCWENTNNAYSQTAMGWLKDGDSFYNANKDNYVSYAESHDEERNFFKAKKYGNGAIKTDESVRLNRIAANVAMNIFLNGPQMIWMFEELGYDYSIEENGRTGTKPIPEALGFYKNHLRMNQYQKIGQMIQLRTRILPDVFTGNPKDVKIGSAQALRSATWGDGAKSVFVVSNLSASENKTYKLPNNSNSWYDYLSDSQAAINAGTELSLKPGEVKVYTGKYHKLPTVPGEYSFDDYVGIESPEFENSCKVYPTMTDGYVYVDTDETIESIRVYSMLGELMSSYSASERINISSLSQGLYLMVVNLRDRQEAFKIYRK